MLLLPHKVGPITLMRRLGFDGISESYVGILDEPAGKSVVARQLAHHVLRDPGRMAAFETRIKDLLAVHHPGLVPVLRVVEVGTDRYVLEEWVEGIPLTRVIQWCADRRRAIPSNVYLNLATQICNGLEALHSRPGVASGAENVLHLGLTPEAVLCTLDGRVVLGNYGLVRSPTGVPQADSAAAVRLEYLSPEQTHIDQRLGPPSDVFALGGLLYELLTGKPMFKAESPLQTIHKIRRAEVTTHLLEVKELLSGLDKVLYRALSLNPRHRYQRAFVLREDLRGLMAGFSFANIAGETKDFLLPMFQRTRHSDESTNDTPVGSPTPGVASQRERQTELHDSSTPPPPSLDPDGPPVLFGQIAAPSPSDRSTDAITEEEPARAPKSASGERDAVAGRAAAQATVPPIEGRQKFAAGIAAAPPLQATPTASADATTPRITARIGGVDPEGPGWAPVAVAVAAVVAALVAVAVCAGSGSSSGHATTAPAPLAPSASRVPLPPPADPAP